MKECNFGIEASFGIPFNYENGYESMTIELTDEQFERYCHALGHWRTTEEWRSRNDDNGHDYFIKRDLPDIWSLLRDKLAQVAPLIWDGRINDYLDQINIYTADEIWEGCD